MTLTQLLVNVSVAQGKKLSGGITCNGLKIRLSHLAGKMPELLVMGDVTITIKVFDLTTTGAPKLYSLINYTQHNIANKLKGETMEYNRYLDNYDTKANKFTKDKMSIYNVRYRINYIVKLEKIDRLSQLNGNDFVLAVVDRIGFKSRGGIDTSAGLTNGEGGPCTVDYNYWRLNPNIATHEFFHTLGLPDLYGKANNKRMMFEFAGSQNTIMSNNELLQMNVYLMKDLTNMAGSFYSNKNLNTVDRLHAFLNKPTNGFKYNKAKFR